MIEEVEEEEEQPKKKKDGRGRPRKVQEPEPEINDDKLLERRYMSQKQKMQQQTYNNKPQSQYRDRFDTILDETNIDLLRQEMKKEMKRRLMSSLFD